MSSQRQVLLGLFFVFVFGILGYFTLFKTDLSLFGERHLLTVHFKDVGGLRPGNSVMVAGWRAGKVEGVSYDPDADPDRRITVELSLRRQVELFQDHVIRIRDASVLGGKQISIEPGLADSGPRVEELLFGEVSLNVLEALGGVVEENRTSLRRIMSGLEDVVVDLREGPGIVTKLLYDGELGDNLSKAVTSITATFENAEVLTSDMKQGQGTLGRLIYDEALYGQIQSIADNLDGLLLEGRALVEDVRAGRGTVGALLYDERTRADVQTALASMAEILDDVNHGRGTLGMLVKDGRIGENVAALTSNLAQGRGTLGRLFAEDEIYENVLAISEDLLLASRALSTGQGTIGKLLNEDELYVQLEQAVRNLTGTLEEAREAAPIATFLNTVFLGF